MSGLREYFRENGYTPHRSMRRRERLPVCCRSERWKAMQKGIRVLGKQGEDVILPLVRCPVCGRQYAVSDGKYLPVENALQFDIVNL